MQWSPLMLVTVLEKLFKSQTRKTSNAPAAYGQNRLLLCGFAEGEKGNSCRETMKTSCLPLCPQECAALLVWLHSLPSLFLSFWECFGSWGFFVARRRQAFCQTARETVAFLSCQHTGMGLSDSLVNISFEAQIARSQKGVRAECFSHVVSEHLI